MKIEYSVWKGFVSWSEIMKELSMEESICVFLIFLNTQAQHRLELHRHLCYLSIIACALLPIYLHFLHLL